MPAQALRNLPRLRGMHVVVEQHGKLRMLRHRLQFWHGQPVIQRHQDGPQPRAGEEQGQLPFVVQAQRGDAVAMAYAPIAREAGRHRLRPLPQCAVRQGLAAMMQRRALRRGQRLRLQRLGQGGCLPGPAGGSGSAHGGAHSSRSPASYSVSRPMRSSTSSAVQGSIRAPQRESR